jgi:hypothetical protein
LTALLQIGKARNPTNYTAGLGRNFNIFATPPAIKVIPYLHTGWSSSCFRRIYVKMPCHVSAMIVSDQTLFGGEHYGCLSYGKR